MTSWPAENHPRATTWSTGSAPMAFATPRADALGFERDTGIDEAVQFFIEDDLTMQKALAE